MLLAAFIIMGFSQTQQSNFYYAYSEKVPLEEMANKIILRYKKNKKNEKGQVLMSLGISDESISWKDDSTCVLVVPLSKMSLTIDKARQLTDVKTLNPVYSLNSGLEMGVTDEFLVKFNEKVTEKEIMELNEKHGVVVIKKTEIYRLLKVPDGSDALEIANLYQETGLTRFSQPNFISDVELHQVPNDTYFANQYSLHNTGQVFTDGHSGTSDADIDAPEAWAVTQGNNNIVIAVLDQGVTPNHPDLPNARQIRLNGSNFADGNANDPSPTGDSNHGNGCAGIIGATRNNNIGIAGIAPNCRIMPIRIFNANNTGITPQRLADAITFARQNGADIISNSWGYNSDNPNLQPVIRDAIIAATTQGRNTRGCVVVFSAGNNLTANGFVHFPSNVNVPGVLTVGASDRFDMKSFYSPLSNTGSPNNQIIDIVAPSHRAYSNQIATETFEAWSLDIPGNPGYNPVKETDGGTLPAIGSILPNTGAANTSYTGRFGGTSYSCPQVAGVAALVLSLNPNLSQQQVFNILTTSTDKVGGYTYTNGFSNQMGFGRLNAKKAVDKAIPIISGPTAFCPSASYSISPVSTGNVNWTAAPANSMTFTQGGFTTTATRSGSFTGSATITATITGNGGVLTATKIVTVGSAISYTWSRIDTYGSVQVNVSGGQSPWKWYLYGTTLIATTYSPNATINFGCNPGSLEVRSTTSCGPVSYTDIIYNSCTSPYMLTVYPNPATSQISVSEVSQEAELSRSAEITESLTTLRNENLLDGAELILMDFSGQILFRKTNSLKNTETVDLDVSSYDKGIYFLKIIGKNLDETHKIMIQ